MVTIKSFKSSIYKYEYYYMGNKNLTIIRIRKGSVQTKILNVFRRSLRKGWRDKRRNGKGRK